MNYREIFAKQKANEKLLIKTFGDISNGPGIYILTREEEGFKYAYVGQAKKTLTRLAQHLFGYQHIDLSLRKHKFYNKEKNPSGWNLITIDCKEEELDSQEQFYIKKYANEGYQLRNKTAGGQSIGKTSLENQRPSKGYYDGVKQGYLNARKYVSNLFTKNLTVSINGKDGVLKQKALQKFKDFINTSEKEN